MIRIDGNALRAAGDLAVELIVSRTLEGRDRFGRPFALYSTRPYALPAGALWAQGSRTAARRLKRQGQIGYFRRQGKLWAIVKGGYRAYKEARLGQGDQVNLTLTGSMLRSLRVLRVDEREGSVTIGFGRTDAAEKAYYHVVSGAGPSRTIRDFLGLTDEELDRVAEVIAQGIRFEL